MSETTSFGWPCLNCVLSTGTMGRCQAGAPDTGDLKVMLYIVSYDLRKPGQDYSGLTEELERLGGKKVLLSQWAMRRTNTSAKALREHFQKFIDDNDRLLVTQVDDWSSWNALISINDV